MILKTLKKSTKAKKWIIGIDEVGRGPLAGPVTICAVVMNNKDYLKINWQKFEYNLNDSKKMSVFARNYWAKIAKHWRKEGTIQYEIVSKSANMIDKNGISVCIKLCINNALLKLGFKQSDILVKLDGGLKAPAIYPNQETIIKGDQKEKIISLASVIAKVRRDRYMVLKSKEFGVYDWESNKGYGTKAHQIAIKNKGLTPLHRKTYLIKLLDNNT